MITNEENAALRFITTKTGTHVMWYDPVARKRRRINLSKINRPQYCYGMNYVAGLQR